MIRAAAFTLAFALFPAALAAQQSAPSPATPASQTATCPPATTLDDLARALDDAVSGPGNKDRACLRDLMLPEARLSPVVKSPDGAYSPRLLTVDGWINAVAKRGSTAFYEHQIKVQAEDYGHFAHLWSTYEIRDTPDGKATVTGINSIQAVNDGKRWHVISILWEPDTTAGPVPKKYLP
jgi:hypothetical protein